MRETGLPRVRRSHDSSPLEAADDEAASLSSERFMPAESRRLANTGPIDLGRLPGPV
jgi:hypothetical protein